MAWKTSTTTKHTCNEGHGPAFGKKTPGCPRCDELIAGAAPVQWAGAQHKCPKCQRRQSFTGLCGSCSVQAHFSSQRHLTGGCGPVCTFGDW